MGEGSAGLVSGLRGAVGLAAVASLALAALAFPLPHAALDLAHAAHLAACAALCVASLRAPVGALRALPAALVAVTVGRLVLEVAVTRALLGDGDAGAFVRALGAGGDARVAATMAALAVVAVAQVLLVAAGGERSAEVAARFALDALPGRQLAVDADLRAGALDAEEAALRRRALLDRAALRGAMDGASRFVRGDAVVGLVVVAVNALLGTVAAMVFHDVPASEALRRSAGLAAGQGLATRVPAVLVAGAVTAAMARRDREDDADGDLVDAPTLVGAALVVVLVGAIAGAPAVPFGVVVVGVGAATLWRARRATARGGAGLVMVCASPRSDAQRAAMKQRAEATIASLGIPAAVAVRAEGERDALLVHDVLAATRTTDVAVEAWFDDAVRLHAWRLVGLREARDVAARVARASPTLSRVVLSAVGLPRVAEVLRRLLREGVAIVCAREVFEALARAEAGAEVAMLVEAVRRALGASLTATIAQDGVLRAWRLDPLLLDVLRDHARRRPTEPPDAALAADVTRSLRRAVGDTPTVVLLVPQDARRHVRAALERDMPTVVVIGDAEYDGAVTTLGVVAP